MEHKKLNRALVVVTVVVTAIVGWSQLARGSGTWTHDVIRKVESNVTVNDRIHINEKAGSQVIVAHITVRPGGHTFWHYHPGPHIVSVRTGTVEVYETDCTFTTYPTGTGFFDPGPTHHPHIHTLRNPSSTEVAEVVITDIRTDDLRPTVPADPQPEPCFS